MREKRKIRINGKVLLFLCILFLTGILERAHIVYAAELPESAGAPEVYLSETEVSMAPATTKTLKLIGAPAAVKWSSSNQKVAEVDASSGKVTAKAKGTTVITATCKKKKYTCTVTVAYKKHTAADGMRYKDASGSFGRTGRWFKKSVGGGKYYFTNTDGSAIYFKVVGSKYVNINFVSKVSAGTPYYAYSVDGGKMNRQQITKKKISVGNTKTHYVRLIIDATSEYENRWGAEAGVGIKSIQPVTQDGVVAAIKPQNAIIAFYGDSISKGVRTLGMGTPSGTSTTHSFSWYCAEQLDLVPYFAGFGASGIVEKGTADRCYNVINNFSSFRKAESFQADVVVVEHGTNDIYTHGSAYVNEYKKVLSQLHKKFPKAQIMAMIPLNQIHADDIRQAASSYKKWCTVVETNALGLSYTDGIHPNAASSKKIGKLLAKKVAAKRKITLK